MHLAYNAHHRLTEVDLTLAKLYSTTECTDYMRSNNLCVGPVWLLGETTSSPVQRYSYDGQDRVAGNRLHFTVRAVVFRGQLRSRHVFGSRNAPFRPHCGWRGYGICNVSSHQPSSSSWEIFSRIPASPVTITISSMTIVGESWRNSIWSHTSRGHALRIKSLTTFTLHPRRSAGTAALWKPGPGVHGASSRSRCRYSIHTSGW